MLEAFMDRMEEPAGAVSEATPGEAVSAESFEAFFRTEHPRLLRAMFLVTGDRHEAEELAQDAFLAVWERWDRVEAMEDPVGYLYRTAMNRFRSGRRRALRAGKRAVGLVSAEDAFAEADERDAVSRALGMLTPRQRAAVVLTEWLGYESKEAGEILGVKAVTVRVLAHQAREALRERLGDDG